MLIDDERRREKERLETELHELKDFIKNSLDIQRASLDEKKSAMEELLAAARIALERQHIGRMEDDESFHKESPVPIKTKTSEKNIGTSFENVAPVQIKEVPQQIIQQVDLTGLQSTLVSEFEAMKSRFFAEQEEERRQLSVKLDATAAKLEELQKKQEVPSPQPPVKAPVPVALKEEEPKTEPVVPSVPKPQERQRRPVKDKEAAMKSVITELSQKIESTVEEPRKKKATKVPKLTWPRVKEILKLDSGMISSSLLSSLFL